MKHEPIQFRRFIEKPQMEGLLLKYAIITTAAHVRMLAATGIADSGLATSILKVLRELKTNLEEGQNLINASDVDVYDALEKRLRETLSEDASVAFRAKSTNDQLATDLRLFLRDGVLQIAVLLNDLRKQIIELAERDLDVVMPGYTHMQPAEVILLSHWWLANEARFCRDFSRLSDLYKRLNALPLGACVLAGAKDPIDRSLVAKLLGFDEVIENSLDAVSDRDFLIEFGAFASLVGLHLSQLGSELLIWATQEFGFIRLPQHLVLRSQALPLKRNPEILEVLRARPALIYGRLMEFIAELKAITTGYSQDLQECVPGLFDVVETVKLLLDMSNAVLPGLELDLRRMREVACADLINVSKALDYLLAKGIEHEPANRIVEQLAGYCRTRNKYLPDLALSEWQQFSPAFETDIYEIIAMEESLSAFCSFGGSSREQVELALARSKEVLERDTEWLNERSKLACVAEDDWL